jgi:hypothetical protein
MTSKISAEYIVTLQGRTFVRLGGLLELAHQSGLRGISTAMIQVPSQDNGQTAICSATVTIRDASYTAHGDANPGNVSRNIAPHLIRMAESRAVARALRFGLGVGETVLEELGSADEVPPAPVNGTARTPARNGTPNT